MYKGVIAKNFVANQLVCQNHELYYWKSDNSAEIDFLLYTSDGIIPIEVKASNHTKSKSLNKYIEKFNPKYSIKISSKDFGFDKSKKIKSIPLYSEFYIKKDI